MEGRGRGGRQTKIHHPARLGSQQNTIRISYSDCVHVKIIITQLIDFKIRIRIPTNVLSVQVGW